MKFDGYRAQVHLRDAVVKVFTRRGNDWTNRFRKIAADAWHINSESAIIDGEVVVPQPMAPPIFRYSKMVRTIGLDIAKSVFQVHGLDAAGNVIIRRQIIGQWIDFKHTAIRIRFRDLARFLVETTTGFVKFSVARPKTVGGSIAIAAITKHEGFRWVQWQKGFSTSRI